MKISDLFSLSIRAFKTRPMRTVLTILGVSVGIGTVLFLVSLGYGLQNVILNKITTTDSLLSLDISAGTSGMIDLNQENIDKISQIEGVTEISPSVSFSSQLTLGDLTGNGTVNAVSASFFRLSGVKPKYGEGIESDDEYDVVISSAGARMFNMPPDQIIGKKISLVIFMSVKTPEGFDSVDVIKRNEEYNVIGVVEDENSNYVYLPIKTLSDLSITSYDQLKVRVASSDMIDSVKDKIMGQGYLVSSLSDTIDQANKIFRIIQIVLALFGLVALIVSAIGMFNTMTIALLERINEIGIMRSIGVTKKDIKRLFLIESIIMGFAGGVGGVFIGYIAGKLANIGINLLAKGFGGQALQLFYTPTWFIVVILVFSTVIGFITGIYPSMRAAKLNPLDALRYK